MEVACILDVWPLASRPPIEGQGSGTARERPSVAKGAVEGQIWHLGGGSRSSTKRHKALTHDPSKKSREKRSQIEESSDKRKTKEKAPKITKKD
jgi:hypothetical protein